MGQLIEDEQPKFPEDGAGFWGGEIVEEPASRHLFSSILNEGHRVTDVRASGGRNFESNSDTSGNLCIGFIDDSGFDVAGFHGGERGAHVFSWDDFGFYCVPKILLLEVLPSINSGRNCPGIRQGETGDFGRSQVVRTLEIGAVLSGYDDYKCVRQATFSSRGVEQPLFSQSVHFGFIGGEKNISGSACFDLLLEKTGGTKIENDFMAGFFLEIRGNLLERVSETNRSEDSDFRSAPTNRNSIEAEHEAKKA